MEHRAMQDRALVEHDVSDAVGARRADESQIALVEHRLHAGADGRRVDRGATELGRSEPDEHRDDHAGGQQARARVIVAGASVHDSLSVVSDSADYCAATTVTEVRRAAVS
jgi:hypothetical protein